MNYINEKNKTYIKHLYALYKNCHDITEILLTVALNTINPKPLQKKAWLTFVV
jgi:hypothetical protein